MNELILNDSYVLNPRVITINEILGHENELYMKWILISSVILVTYVIWRNFFIQSRYQKWLEAQGIDVDELAILPSLILLIVSLGYYGVV